MDENSHKHQYSESGDRKDGDRLFKFGRLSQGGQTDILIPSIDFYNMYVGALINTTAGVSTVLHTIDGGYSWRPVTVPTNSGLNSIFICEPYLMYAVGERQGHNAMILKITD